MKTQGKVWIIYDAVKKKQSSPMATLQAQVVLLKVRSALEPERYFLWTPGWAAWVSLAKFLETDQTTFVLAPAPVPVVQPAPKTPAVEKFRDETTDVIDDERSDVFTAVVPVAPPTAENKVDYGYYYEDFGIEQLDPDMKSSVQIRLPQKKKSVKERRSALRHSVRIEVILINDSGTTFRTDSLDISTGGTMLRDELPKDFINRRFDVILINKFEKDPTRGRVHIQSRVVGDYRNPRRLMFLSTLR